MYDKLNSLVVAIVLRYSFGIDNVGFHDVLLINSVYSVDTGLVQFLICKDSIAFANFSEAKVVIHPHLHLTHDGAATVLNFVCLVIAVIYKNKQIIFI
jgi:hypothetical protein